MGREGLPEGRAELHEAGVPAYIFPESAARALAALTATGAGWSDPVEEPTRFAVDRERVAALLARVKEEGREHLLEHEALEVLACYGVPVVEHRVTQGEDEAAEAAAALGYPVVLKVLSPDVIHKTDVGAVRVDLRTEEEVRTAHREMLAAVAAHAPGARLEGVLVERFLKGGRETILGMITDPAFGPVLMFGLGGVYVEALGDVVFRVHPVTEVDAREMVANIRGHRLLEGLRGDAPADQAALVEAIQRISQLVGDHDTVLELDVNPFLALPEGGVAVDARVRVGEPPHPSPG